MLTLPRSLTCALLATLLLLTCTDKNSSADNADAAHKPLEQDGLLPFVSIKSNGDEDTKHLRLMLSPANWEGRDATKLVVVFKPGVILAKEKGNDDASPPGATTGAAKADPGESPYYFVEVSTSGAKAFHAEGASTTLYLSLDIPLKDFLVLSPLAPPFENKFKTTNNLSENQDFVDMVKKLFDDQKEGTDKGIDAGSTFSKEIGQPIDDSEIQRLKEQAYFKKMAEALSKTAPGWDIHLVCPADGFDARTDLLPPSPDRNASAKEKKLRLGSSDIATTAPGGEKRAFDRLGVVGPEEIPDF